MSDPVASIRLPIYLKRTLGYASRTKVPFDAFVRLRPWEPTFLLTHPEDIRHVLIDRSQRYLKTPFLTSRGGRQRAGRGLLTSSGEEHRRQRALLRPMFTQEEMDQRADLIVERADRALADWPVSGSLDIGGAMTQLSRSVLLATLFGKDLADEDRIGRDITQRRRYTEYVYNGRLPWRQSLPLPIVLKTREALARLRAVADARIDAARVRPPDQTLVSRLVHARYPDGTEMAQGLIRDEVLSFTHTGYETVADGLTWACGLLADHLEVQEMLIGEIDEVLAGRPPAAADLPALAYTRAVFAETLRLYPPTWVYTRVPRKSDRLPSGHEVRPAAKLYLCPWVMHRHPGYFLDPERFDPERFGPDAPRPPRYVYFPFGAGAHTCLGERLALTEAALVLARTLQRFRLARTPGRRARPYTGVTLRPARGLHLTLTARGADGPTI